MSVTETTYDLGECGCCAPVCDCDCQWCTDDACGYYTQWEFTLNGWVNGPVCNTCTTVCQTVFGGTRTLIYGGYISGCCRWNDANTIPAPGGVNSLTCNHTVWNQGATTFAMSLCKPSGVFKLALGTGYVGIGPAASSDNGGFANPQELCDQTSVAGNFLMAALSSRCCYPASGSTFTLTPVSGTWVDCSDPGAAPMAMKGLRTGLPGPTGPRSSRGRKPVVIKLEVNGVEMETTWDGKGPMTFTVPGDANVTSVQQVPEEGPGTELKKLLKGFPQVQGCACNVRADQMNQWGVTGCLENLPTIVGWLKEAWSQLPWYRKMVAAGRGLIGGTFTVEGLVREAIRRATPDKGQSDVP